MPRSYSGDLREQVIEAVEMEGASRREAAERFDISVPFLAVCATAPVRRACQPSVARDRPAIANVP